MLLEVFQMQSSGREELHNRITCIAFGRRRMKLRTPSSGSNYQSEGAESN